MSLLTLVQHACRTPGINLDSPNAVATSSNSAVLQLLEVANEEGNELARRGAWQALEAEATFTTVAATTQTTLVAIAPNLNYILNDTIWDRTLRRPVFGPLSPQYFQQQTAMVLQGPWYQYRIRQGSILFIPIPSAGHACFFEYLTKAWCTDATGVTQKTAFDNDADVSLLDEHLMKLGIVWRWKQGKGLDYAEDFAKYEMAVTNALGRDASKPILNMGDYQYDLVPAILVPSGSWNV